MEEDDGCKALTTIFLSKYKNGNFCWNKTILCVILIIFIIDLNGNINLQSYSQCYLSVHDRKNITLNIDIHW